MCKIRFEPRNRSSNSPPITSPTASPIPTSTPEIPTRRMTLPRTFCLSSASAALTPSTSLTTFTDHYEVLKLDPCATTDQVKSQYRKLRAEYFHTDASKYRKLQTAYALLVDPESRREYDILYRVSKGPFLPLDGQAAAEAGTAADDCGGTLVKAAVSRIDARAGDGQAEELRRREEEERLRREEDGEERRRGVDPNWHLKHFSPRYTPLLGSEPYLSFVPVAIGYDRMDVESKCRRPAYVGGIASKAMP